MAVIEGDVVIQQVSSGGDGTGTIDMAVNGSGTAQEFSVDASSTQRIVIEHVELEYSDGGTWSSASFGQGVNGALSTGVDILIRNADGTTKIDLTPGNVKTNADWARYTANLKHDIWSAGDEVQIVELKYTNGLQDRVYVPEGGKFVVVIADDLTAVTNFQATFYGYYA